MPSQFDLNLYCPPLFLLCYNNRSKGKFSSIFFNEKKRHILSRLAGLWVFCHLAALFSTKEEKRPSNWPV